MKIDPELNWILTPPDVLPPAVTRLQELPFRQLTPRNFERLCLRLVEKEAEIEHCQGYGQEGQKQHGIDLYAKIRGSERYVTWQCKRHQSFAHKDIEEAVTIFLSGAWAEKTQTFVLAATVDFEEKSRADALEAERIRLNRRGIEFIPLGTEKLSTKLKPHADIVDDFFDRHFAEAFCGRLAVETLRHRKLSALEFVKLRSSLRRYYMEHFEATDKGLPLAVRPAEPIAPLTLSDRYVVQDVLVTKVNTALVNMTRESSQPTQSNEGGPTEPGPGLQRLQLERVEVRVHSLQWIEGCNLGIVLGEPGIGKTAFLRYLILDLLADNPRQSIPAAKWGRLLPIWVPFALWAQMASLPDGKSGLSDVLYRWLNEMSAPPDLQNLVERALEDDRVILFVDGLDEWNN